MNKKEPLLFVIGERWWNHIVLLNNSENHSVHRHQFDDNIQTNIKTPILLQWYFQYVTFRVCVLVCEWENRMVIAQSIICISYER